MMAIVDVFDAVSNDRCYQKACSREEAIQIIVDGKGTSFDPALVDLFLDQLETVLIDV